MGQLSWELMTGETNCGGRRGVEGSTTAPAFTAVVHGEEKSEARAISDASLLVVVVALSMANCIALRDLSVDCIVGIREREQRNLQPLVLDVRMEIAAPSLEAAASTGALDQSLNYSAVAKQLAFVCQHGQWGLLESLSTAICRLLLLEPAPGEGRAAVEAVEPGVALVVLEEAPCSAAYRATLAPGASWALPADLAVFVLAGDVSEPGGAAVRPAGTLPRGGGVALRAGARGAALLLVGRPLRPSSRL